MADGVVNFEEDNSFSELDLLNEFTDREVWKSEEGVHLNLTYKWLEFSLETLFSLIAIIASATKVIYLWVEWCLFLNRRESVLLFINITSHFRSLLPIFLFIFLGCLWVMTRLHLVPFHLLAKTWTGLLRSSHLSLLLCSRHLVETSQDFRSSYLNHGHHLPGPEVVEHLHQVRDV